MANIELINLGITDYRKALTLQEDFVQQRIAGQISDKIIITEHSPTITLGARKSANKLLADTDSLTEQGIDVIKIGRGGGTTAHNPGQLVVYPIVNIKERNFGISEFVRALEAIGIELLDTFGVQAERKKGLPGLWVGDKKIASIGIKIKKWTTFHGIAINIDNDLSIFDFFVPCGLDGVIMTSVTQQKRQKTDIDKARKVLNTIIKKHFNIENNNDG